MPIFHRLRDWWRKPTRPRVDWEMLAVAEWFKEERRGALADELSRRDREREDLSALRKELSAFRDYRREAERRLMRHGLDGGMPVPDDTQ